MVSEQRRADMVSGQLRTWDVQEPKILSVMGEIPREDFVPSPYQGVAYVDGEIPIGQGQLMLPPKWQAKALQMVELHSADTVLEIGTGTGYLTNCIAELAFHVFSLEICPELAALAKANLAERACSNVDLLCEDGSAGLPAHAPYDVIISTAAFPAFPEKLAGQLREGGRMFAVIGQAPVMQACLFHRVCSETWIKTVVFETNIPLIQQSAQTETFNF